MVILPPYDPEPFSQSPAQYPILGISWMPLLCCSHTTSVVVLSRIEPENLNPKTLVAPKSLPDEKGPESDVGQKRLRLGRAGGVHSRAGNLTLTEDTSKVENFDFRNQKAWNLIHTHFLFLMITGNTARTRTQ